MGPSLTASWCRATTEDERGFERMTITLRRLSLSWFAFKDCSYRSVNTVRLEAFALLGRYAAYVGSWFLTIRVGLLELCIRDRLSRNVGNQVPLFIQKDRRPQLHLGKRLKPRTLRPHYKNLLVSSVVCNVEPGHTYNRKPAVLGVLVKIRDKLSSANENTQRKPVMAAVRLVFESQRETTRKN